MFVICLYNLIIITWSSVTARLRNSHSFHLHTPGVITRKPLPVNLNSRVVSFPGAHFSIYLTHDTGVTCTQHHSAVEAVRSLLPLRLLQQLRTWFLYLSLPTNIILAMVTHIVDTLVPHSLRTCVMNT